MKKKINLYRVVLNMLFYIFYVLLVSIIFSFIFPTILVILWKSVLEPTNPLFIKIQYAIVILVFIFTLAYRKFFYLPVFSTEAIIEKKDLNVEIIDNKEPDNFKTEEVKVEVIENIQNVENVENSIIKVEEFEERLWSNNFPDLDIKIGKEIK